MQDLSESVFINMANLTLARCDRYLDYLKAEVKQDILTALCNAQLHIQSLFPDHLLIKAEEEVFSKRRSSSSSHKKPGRFHLYAASTGKSSHQPDQKSGVPAWKQIRDRQQGKNGQGKASTYQQKLAKG